MFSWSLKPVADARLVHLRSKQQARSEEQAMLQQRADRAGEKPGRPTVAGVVGEFIFRRRDTRLKSRFRFREL